MPEATATRGERARQRRQQRAKRRAAIFGSAALGVVAVGAIAVTTLTGAGATASADASIGPNLQELSQEQAQAYAVLAVSGEASQGATIDDRGSGVSIDVVPTDPASLKKITEEMVKTQYGWGADQMSCLDKLWMKESGWNYLAENAESGAYGIPQSWPAEKLATMGADWKTNPITQIKWGIDYIDRAWGTPCAAWNQHNGSY